MQLSVSGAAAHSSRLKAWYRLGEVARLEYGILTDLCVTLLNRYNIVSTALQSSSLELNNAVALLK